MNRLATTILATTLVFTIGAQCSAVEFDYPPTIAVDELRTQIDKIPPKHPRLLTTRGELEQLRKSLAGDKTRQSLADAVIKQATLLRDVPAIERKLTGRRLLGQSRLCVKRVVLLSMAYHLSGDVQHVRRCEKEMLAAARFKDWNPSHFLDVGEMTFALAIGYDWLYEQLDEATRQEIRTAIVEKGLNLPIKNPRSSWIRASNNWGQVCHGGLTAGAMAVAEHEPELAARTVHNSLQNVTRSMHAFEPKGSYPEGPGYWAYGTTYNVLLIGVLESSLGTDFGLNKAPGFSETGQYVSLACGPTGLFFNYADGGAGRAPQPALFWFASRYDRPDWLIGERERLLSRVASYNASHAASSSDRMLPLALLWMGADDKNIKNRMPLHWQGEGSVPIAIHRSSWTDPNATFIGFKGGAPSANHGQMDIGSFVLEADGVRWSMDLGAEGYHGIESRGMNLWSRSQKSDRWTIFRQSNFGHSTLVIDGKLQRAAGKGRMIDFSDAPKLPHSVLDMSDVYAGQAKSVQRGVALLDSRNVLIQDHLTGLKPGSRVRWGMLTPASIEVSSGTSIELRKDNAQLTLTVLSPQKATWQTIDTATPRNRWDSPNLGTQMVAFEAIAPASGELTLAVFATPDTSSAEPKLRPLTEWSSK